MRQALVEVRESVAIAWCQLTVFLVPSRREAFDAGKLAGYATGYKHGRKDGGALKLVVDNPAPAGVYEAKHAEGKAS